MPCVSPPEHTENIDWLSQFSLIRRLIAQHIPTGRNGKFSAQAAEKFLGVTPKKWRAWEKGQRPSAGDLEIIGRVLGLQPQWLLFGEGTPFTPEKAAAQTDCSPQPMPSAFYDTEKEMPPMGDTRFTLAAPSYAIPQQVHASGFAEGPPPAYNAQPDLAVTALSPAAGHWYTATPLPLRQTLPKVDPHWLTVQMPDDDMAPAGLHAGEMLYCDPHSMPRTDDAVCIVRHDGAMAVRVWLGCEAGAILLQGFGPNGPFKERMPAAGVYQIAPIIFVQRRV